MGFPRLKYLMTPKEWYQYCKKNHLCVVCHKPVDGNKAYCTECAEKNRLRNQEVRDYYISLRICPVCRSNDLAGNEKSCPECRARKAERERTRNRDRIYSYAKAKRDKRKKEGLCVICGTKLDEKDLGHAACSDCRNKRRQRYADSKNSVNRSKRASRGRCYICGSKDLADGSKLCVLCHKRVMKNLSMAWDATRRTDGQD